ncbi:YCF20-LIKE PROTEIN [Salix viminalis]|uniref:YCF20-LIKE PROTEIN n=1 Tax=Salix viminalis TaxID=40686 RepID=A0A9Q0UH32_SALVM|nr:YCF20-LIKE PROTEIN [Salix viminalis]
MATTMTLPNNPIKSKTSTTKCLKTAGFHRTACASGRKLYSRCSFVHVAEPYLAKNFRRRVWQIKSSVDSSGLDPTSSSSGGGGTRLVRAIQAFRTRLGARIREIRKNLPMKLLFFLVGFYCATAFATVIGQTGDWDILSAALAVVVVEGIGALMYRASFSLVKSIRSIISMFNYWKAGLTLGLFLDSFKYEIDKNMSFSNLFSLEMDIVSLIL